MCITEVNRDRRSVFWIDKSFLLNIMPVVGGDANPAALANVYKFCLSHLQKINKSTSNHWL